MILLNKMDINGSEMDDLYKYLKRNSPLFMPRIGRSERLYDLNAKFLCDRYGQVKKYYAPSVSLHEIGKDIEDLLP